MVFFAFIMMCSFAPRGEDLVARCESCAQERVRWKPQPRWVRVLDEVILTKGFARTRSPPHVQTNGGDDGHQSRSREGARSEERATIRERELRLREGSRGAARRRDRSAPSSRSSRPTESGAPR